MRRLTSLAGLFIGILLTILLPVLPVGAQQVENCSKVDAVLRGTQFYKCDAADSCGTDTNVISELSGSDNEQRGWNFLRAKGLDDMHTAAVIGNLMQESSLNPLIMEKGGTSDNPADADPLGWGIAQWTPGSKITGIAQDLNINTPIAELGTQLEIVWQEMVGTAPTGAQKVLEGLNQQTSLSDAVEYFRVHFEGGTPGKRQQFAEEALQKYGGSPGSNTSSAGGGAGGCAPSSSLAPDCQNASGTAKILCAAKVYDPVSYEESARGGHQGAAAWHQSCPTIGPDCVLDCSGLVNIAVYDVYGVDLNQITFGEVSDTTDWKRIDLSELRAGDLIQPNTGHVEIVDHVQGEVIYTFGAHSSHYPQEKQVGPSSMPVAPSNVYLRYIGPGADN